MESTLIFPIDSLEGDDMHEALMQNNVRVSDAILEAMSREAERTGVDANGLFDEAAKQLLAHRHVAGPAALAVVAGARQLIWTGLTFRRHCGTVLFNSPIS